MEAVRCARGRVGVVEDCRSAAERVMKMGHERKEVGSPDHGALELSVVPKIQNGRPKLKWDGTMGRSSLSVWVDAAGRCGIGYVEIL